MVDPVFIDADGAGERLRVPIEVVLDLVKEGKLKAYGGRPNNPFLRSADVLALAPEVSPPLEEETGPKRVRSGSARVQTRVTADARWADVSEADIRDWVQRADPVRRRAAGTAARTAVARLQLLLETLEEASS